MSLAALAAERDERLAALREALGPLRTTLAQQPFLAGPAPNYADHIVFGASNGRGWRARSRSSPPTTPRSAPGANACSTPTAASPAGRRARFEATSSLIAPRSRSGSVSV